MNVVTSEDLAAFESRQNEKFKVLHEELEGIIVLLKAHSSMLGTIVQSLPKLIRSSCSPEQLVDDTQLHVVGGVK